jgi:hypothetical protein
VSKLREAEHEVIAAAECVTHSFRAYAGYTVPLSINLRRLDSAVRHWAALIHAAQLDSDTNGFDRSTMWGHSNEQTSTEASRRQGCAAAKPAIPSPAGKLSDAS